MESLDEVHDRMCEFGAALDRFQDALESSCAELGRFHEAVDPLWQDSSRRDYDGHYEPLREMLERYVRTQGPEYRVFIDRKLAALRAYLFGPGA
jgi:hypothetical protein